MFRDTEAQYIASRPTTSSSEAKAPSKPTTPSRHNPEPVTTDIANPLKHPENIAGDFRWVIPGVIKGDVPVGTLDEIALMADKVWPGESIRWKQQVGKEGHRQAYSMVLYPRGLPVAPKDTPKVVETEVETHRKNKIKTVYRYKHVVRYNFSRYKSDKAFRAANPNKPVEAMVQIQGSFTDDEFRMRYFGRPADRESHSRRIILDHTTNWKDTITIAYDKYGNPAASALSCDTFNPDDPKNKYNNEPKRKRELAFDVHKKHRQRGLALTMAKTLGGIAKAQGDDILEIDFLNENSGMRKIFLNQIPDEIKKGNLLWGEVNNKIDPDGVVVNINLNPQKNQR